MEIIPLERLIALNLSEQDQSKLCRLIPEIFKIAEDYGEFTFSFDRKDIYTGAEERQKSSESSKKSRKIKFGFTGNISKKIIIFIWFIASSIAAVLNIKSAEAAIPDIYEKVEGPLAFIISIVIIFIVDFIIASQITFLYSKRDAEREESFFIGYKGKGRNLSSGLISNQKKEGEIKALRKAQERYLSKLYETENSEKSKKIPLDIKIELWLLSAYFSIEFIASIYSVYQYGILNLFAISAPLLAALINVMSGYFRGRALAYPSERKKISGKYEDIYSKLAESNIEDDVYLMNYLTNEYRKNTEVTSEEIENLKMKQKTWITLRRLRGEFFREFEALDIKPGEKLPKQFLNEEYLEVVKKALNLINKYKNELNDFTESAEYLNFSPEMLQGFSSYLNEQYYSYNKQLDQLEKVLEEEASRQSYVEKLNQINTIFDEHNEVVSNYQNEYRNAMENIRNNFNNSPEYNPSHSIAREVKESEAEKDFTMIFLSQIRRTKKRLRAIDAGKIKLDSGDIGSKFRELEEDEKRAESKINQLEEYREKHLNPRFKIMEIEKYCTSLRSKFKKKEFDLEQKMHNNIRQMRANYLEKSATTVLPLGTNVNDSIDKQTREFNLQYTREILEEIERCQNILIALKTELIALQRNTGLVDKIYQDFEEDKSRFTHY